MEETAYLGVHIELLASILPYAGKGQMWSPSDDDQIPEYYRQWAATLARLGHDERMRTLAQMSEEDRLIVQRLMDRSSVRLPGSTDLDRPEVPSSVLLLIPRSAANCTSVLRVASMLGVWSACDCMVL